MIENRAPLLPLYMYLSFTYIYVRIYSLRRLVKSYSNYLDRYESASHSRRDDKRLCHSLVTNEQVILHAIETNSERERDARKYQRDYCLNVKNDVP